MTKCPECGGREADCPRGLQEYCPFDPASIAFRRTASQVGPPKQFEPDLAQDSFRIGDYPKR